MAWSKTYRIYEIYSKFYVFAAAFLYNTAEIEEGRGRKFLINF